MIQLAVETDFVREITTESELRICALECAYGLDAPFIQFFADGEGSIASIMDGFCTVYCPSEPSEEWITFLRMLPDVRTIHSDANTIVILAKRYDLTPKSGSVMRLGKVLSVSTLRRSKPEDISLREVYPLLSSAFDELPPFDGWYVDTSHRVRHGCCHIASVKKDGQLISIAMTVAETKVAALIGGVTTLPHYRGQGAASRCINDLIATLPQNTILIAPNNESAERLYKKLGFVPWGTWAEITLP